MRKQITLFACIIPLFLLLLDLSGVEAQRRYAPLASEDFNYMILHQNQTSPTTFEFDLSLLDTDTSNAMNLAGFQAGIFIDPVIYNGGTITAQIVAGHSDLPIDMQPNSITFTQSVNIIKMVGQSPPGFMNSPTVSKKFPGTQLTRIRITNSVPFSECSQSNMVFASSTVLNPYYPTRVSVYVSGVNTQLVVTAGINALDMGGNPVLSAPTVASYIVGGSGSYCPGDAGTAITLSGSQPEASYQLYKGDISIGTAIAGTGEALNWLNEFAGTYTIGATYLCGFAPMSGNAVITEASLPGAAGTITGLANVVPGSAGVPYSIDAISDATSYEWSYSGTGVTMHSSSTNSITVDFSTTSTSGHFSVYGKNTCGNGAVSPFFNVTLPSGFNEHTTGILVYSSGHSICIRNLGGLRLQQVFVFDLIGKEVFHSGIIEEPLQKYILDVDEGYYLVKVVSDKGVTTRKVFIN